MGVAFNGGVRDIFNGCSVPPIYDICKTVDMLLETEKSFSRFGDGEFKLMTEPDVNHVFQKGSPEIMGRLKEIISSNEDGVEIGINRIYFYSDGFDHPRITNFLYKKGYAALMCKYRYLDFLTKRDHYYDSVFSIPMHHYTLNKEFFEWYFGRVKSIWKNRSVVLVTGDAEIMKYNYNIFTESAKSVRLVEISKVDAFEYHDRIMKYIDSLGLSKKDDLILLVCGLEGTILAYDLAEKGYRALDVGHIAKEYFGFRNNIIPYSHRDRHFFG